MLILEQSRNFRSSDHNQFIGFFGQNSLIQLKILYSNSHSILAAEASIVPWLAIAYHIQIRPTQLLKHLPFADESIC
ncbi:hypothetical protein H6G10_29655 [Anabaena cylindrica FACHB-170]|uniref:hypothetical protein n=1 Tax=Nostocaceae TaxID=1162 RepID=UPI0011D160EC|nr:MULTISPECIES: hypothetical protein [Nostocaceae]MBD2287257.1 hypothetical protein [Anabaena cylindrica FACHB-170]